MRVMKGWTIPPMIIDESRADNEKGWTTMPLIERDDIPVFTYVADGPGTCGGCHLSFREGATVVRIGVAYNESGGWRTYHMVCYAPSTTCT